jgi:Flp pilus assembly protein TadB
MSMMDAGPGRVSRSALLRDALAFSRALCDRAYARADGEALRQQRRHRKVVDVVAAAGTAAILAGIAPLAQPLGGTAAKSVEAVAALTALVAVVFGLYARSQRRWLLERHRAERVREVQYRALIALVAQPSADLARWTTDLRERIGELEGLTLGDMERWLVHDEAPSLEHASNPSDDGAVSELAAIYTSQRLHGQCEYFRRRAERNERVGRATGRLVSWLFFVSVGAVVPASLIRILRGPDWVALIFVAIAAGAPALAAGIRLFRSAHEFSRNGARFRTKHLALSALRERIDRGSSPSAVVHDLQRAEKVLAAEHREWLRLMLDAEWYG